MFDSKALIISINILQIIATFLVASEYFIGRKKLGNIEKYFSDLYKNMTLSSNDRINILNLNYPKNKNKNMFKLLLSISVLVILSFWWYQIISNDIMTRYIILSTIIFTILLFVLISCIVIYSIKLSENKVKKINHIFYYELIGKFIFKRPRYPLVRLGLVLFIISFILNIYITLEWNKTILSLFIIFLFLVVILYLGILYEAYRKLYRKKNNKNR
ncbi:MAG: hypothetical protein DRQ78_03810 [Epsilonproteobacteria bacterium]|nr:MAG: hypothetical protein DRQ78_03810 [Campylobacterota bacterium]